MYFFKNASKLSRAKYQNKLVANQLQGACLLMMQGESAQCTWRTLAERRQNDRDGGLKTKEENVYGTKEGLNRVYTGHDSCHVTPRHNS